MSSIEDSPTDGEAVEAPARRGRPPGGSKPVAAEKKKKRNLAVELAALQSRVDFALLALGQIAEMDDDMPGDGKLVQLAVKTLRGENQ